MKKKKKELQSKRWVIPEIWVFGMIALLGI